MVEYGWELWGIVGNNWVACELWEMLKNDLEWWGWDGNYAEWVGILGNEWEWWVMVGNGGECVAMHYCDRGAPPLGLVQV